MSTCNCMGPQNGAPLCPCKMRAVMIGPITVGVYNSRRYSKDEPQDQMTIRETLLGVDCDVCPACQAIHDADLFKSCQACGASWP